jgi:hypothetical protein
MVDAFNGDTGEVALLGAGPLIFHGAVMCDPNYQRMVEPDGALKAWKDAAKVEANNEYVKALNSGNGNGANAQDWIALAGKIDKKVYGERNG